LKTTFEKGSLYVIKSFLSFSFLRPPNAIFVPGMYFLGFSRYSNYIQISILPGYQDRGFQETYESVLVPGDGLLLVGIGVCVAFNSTSLTSEKAVQVGTDLVSLTSSESVALSTSGLEEPGTLLCVTCERSIVSRSFWCFGNDSLGSSRLEWSALLAEKRIRVVEAGLHSLRSIRTVSGRPKILIVDQNSMAS
jgi:hypothetical protein